MKNYIAIIAAALFCSCQKSELPPRDFVHWVQDESNGLNISKELGSYTFSLQYRPAEYITVIEKKKDIMHRDSLMKRVKELQGLQYYTLTITSKEEKEVLQTGISSEEELYERMEYLNSRMQDDLWLIDGNDSLPCRLFHFERSYQLAPYNKVVIAFDNTDLKHDRTLLFNDHALGVGPVRFTIKASSLAAIPQLKVN